MCRVQTTAAICSLVSDNAFYVVVVVVVTSSHRHHSSPVHTHPVIMLASALTLSPAHRYSSSFISNNNNNINNINYSDNDVLAFMYQRSGGAQQTAVLPPRLHQRWPPPCWGCLPRPAPSHTCMIANRVPGTKPVSTQRVMLCRVAGGVGRRGTASVVEVVSVGALRAGGGGGGESACHGVLGSSIL